MRTRTIDIYRGRDPRTIGAYTLTDVARHLHVPVATARLWARGTSRGEPVVDIADPARLLFSFENLIEVHVLNGLRKYGLSLPHIRRTVQLLKDELAIDRPLADERMATDGKSILMQYADGRICNVSRRGQNEMGPIIAQFLKRIERDPTSGSGVRLFPYLTKAFVGTRTNVQIDPRIQFGQPCLRGSRVPTSIVASRRRAGDSVAALARDYQAPESAIRDALTFEGIAAA